MLVVLFIASLAPLVFLDLNGASQLAGALALPLSVVLAALPLLPAAKPSSKPLPWRRYSLIGAAVAGLLGLGAVGYAVWDNFSDIEITFPGSGKPEDPPWTHGSQTLLPIPGTPPERNNMTITVHLRNVHETGDCENTAILGYTPVLDGQEKQPVTGAPGKAVTVPLHGVRREAAVKVALRYDKGNESCEVRLHIDKVVLND
jgi:hypothetical protein